MKQFLSNSETPFRKHLHDYQEKQSCLHEKEEEMLLTRSRLAHMAQLDSLYSVHWEVAIKPKGILFKRCPFDNHRLQRTKMTIYRASSYIYTYYKCPTCDFEYMKESLIGK